MERLKGQNVGLSAGDPIFCQEWFSKNLFEIYLCVGVTREISGWYKRQGFTHVPPWTVDKTLVQIKSIPKVADVSSVVDVSPANFGALAAYDRGIAGGVDRSGFLKGWFKHPNGRFKVAVDRSGTVEGYGGVRDGSKDRLRIGPLYADSREIARELVFALLATYDPDMLEGRVVEFIGVSDQKWLDICEAIGTVLSIVQSQLHFTREVPACDWSKIYCLFDLEVNFV